MTVRLLGAGLALALLAGAGVQAAPASPLMAPIHTFIDSFNKGDIKTAQATHVAAPTIIDEPPPHLWQGAGAFMAWAADLDKDAKLHGQTDQKVVLGPPVRTQVDGDSGYAVVKAALLYKEHGKAMVEPAQFAFALHKESGGWKIAGWTWAGEVAHPASTAKPKP